MSKTKMPLRQAQELAQEVVDLLSPFCEKIEIAGSVRRQKEMVGDIEIVCIPKVEERRDLFGQVISTYRPIDQGIIDAIGNDGDLWFRVNGQKLKSFYYKDVQIDLFLTTLVQWGYMFTLRTGSQEFSHKIVTKKKSGGWLPDYLTVTNGYVYATSDIYDKPEPAEPIPVTTEEAFFDLLGLDWVDPKDRN